VGAGARISEKPPHARVSPRSRRTDRGLRPAVGYDTRTRQRFGDRIDARYERYVAVLTAVFKRGVESGALASRPPRRLAVTLAGLIHAVIRRGLRERRIDFTVEGDALLDILLHGVLPRGPGAGTSR
jgi:hypothetical protein